MSWVFLTDTQAWKLKKASRFALLDLRAPETRRRNCEEEVRLNRRLAPDVYRGVVPLTVSSAGTLQLDKPGIIDDWLVRMRRLPSELMLDRAIATNTWTKENVVTVGTTLAKFYSATPPLPITAENYVQQLKNELRSSNRELTIQEEALNREAIDNSVNSALAFVQEHLDLLAERVNAGRIVEGHGDLRPEHICLEDEPVIIDCLEFDRNLRMIDPASELMFLKLECERLGAPAVAELIFGRYCEHTGDEPPEELLEFYRTYHAAVRAKIAILHVADASVLDTQKWIERAAHYLAMAA